MEPTRLQKLFTRWAGISPKAFLQAITLERARRLLEESATVLDTTYEVGLSGPGRLHDLFVTHEAVTPGTYRARGEGLLIRYGFHASPFGMALVMATDYGLAGLAFADEGGEPAALADMMRRWPKADYVADEAATAPLASRIFDPRAMAAGDAAPHRLHRHGFRDPRMGDAPEGALRLRHDLFRRRPPDRQPERGARRRRGGRQEPDLLRRPVSSRARALGRAHRLPLGPDAQARHSRLGSGGSRRDGLTPQRKKTIFGP